MKVKIIGIGKRRQGVSKNGREYDFTPVAFAYEEPGFEGHVCATCNVGQSVLNTAEPVKVGQEREFYTYFANYRMNVNGIR